MPEIDYSRIELLVLDVDGVLTDGRIVLTPGGEEIKSFSVRDEAGMKYWKRAGGKLALVTGRAAAAVRHRAEELAVDAVRLGAKRKGPACEEVLAELGVAPERACAMGDDLTDLPMLRRCGFSAAPADAVDEVRRAVDYVAAAPGGAGCVREVIELILRKSGRWERIMVRYLPDGDMGA